MQLPMTIWGKTIRTTNQTPEEIVQLWQDVLPHMTQAGDVFAVYTNYESDATGYYDITVGNTMSSTGENTVIIPTAKYQVFQADTDIAGSATSMGTYLAELYSTTSIYCRF